MNKQELRDRVDTFHPTISVQQMNTWFRQSRNLCDEFYVESESDYRIQLKIHFVVWDQEWLEKFCIDGISISRCEYRYGFILFNSNSLSSEQFFKLEQFTFFNSKKSSIA